MKKLIIILAILLFSSPLYAETVFVTDANGNMHTYFVNEGPDGRSFTVLTDDSRIYFGNRSGETTSIIGSDGSYTTQQGGQGFIPLPPARD